MRTLFRFFLLVGLAALLSVGLSGPFAAQGQEFTSPFPSGELLAAPNALYAYAYGSPIYDVPGELLHVTQFRGRNAPLNLWPFFYDPGTRVWVVGRDQGGLFFLVVVDTTGQTVWIPRFELAGVNDGDLMSLSVIWTSNAPFFQEGELILPVK